MQRKKLILHEREAVLLCQHTKGIRHVLATERSGGDFGKQGREREVVPSVDQDDARSSLGELRPRQVCGGIQPTETAAHNDDTWLRRPHQNGAGNRGSRS